MLYFMALYANGLRRYYDRYQAEDDVSTNTATNE